MNIILQVHSKMIGHFRFFEQMKNGYVLAILPHVWGKKRQGAGRKGPLMNNDRIYDNNMRHSFHSFCELKKLFKL